MSSVPDKSEDTPPPRRDRRRGDAPMRTADEVFDPAPGAAQPDEIRRSLALWAPFKDRFAAINARVREH